MDTSDCYSLIIKVENKEIENKTEEEIAEIVMNKFRIAMNEKLQSHHVVGNYFNKKRLNELLNNAVKESYESK